MSNPFVFDGATLSDYTAWLAGGVDTDNVVRSFAVGETGALQVTGMTTTESLTTSGGLITPATRALNVDGDGLPVDSGYGIWPAATNLVTNGGFETNTTGWADSLTDFSITQSDEQAKFGGFSGKVEATAAQSGNFPTVNFIITVTAAVHTYSAWLYIPTAYSGDTIRLNIAGFTGGSGTAVNANMSLRDQWQRVSMQFTPVSGDLLGAVLVQSAGSMDSGSFYYIDGVQVETGSIATPYIETDGSTESRTAGRIQMPVADLFTETQGAVFARTMMGWPSASTPNAGPGFFSWADDNNNGIRAFWSTGATSLSTRRASGGNLDQSLVSASWSSGDAISSAYQWGPTTVTTSFDGGAFVTPVGDGDIPTLSATLADIGQDGVFAGTRQIDSNILWFATFAGTLTDADAAALNALGDTPPTWAQLVSSVAICAMPTALWRAEDDTFIKASYAPDGGS